MEGGNKDREGKDREGKDRERKRPPSYSDSYYVLNGNPLEPLHTPVLEPLYSEPLHVDPLHLEIKEVKEVNTSEPCYHTLVRFTLKGSLHLLFISSFESIFYFLFVSVSEDTGILSTVNTYYMPLLSQCSSWSNMSRAFLKDILSMELNQTLVDSQGAQAAQKRSAFNLSLITTSSIYSLVFLAISLGMICIIRCKRIKLQWKRLFAEHLAFVVLLAGYEYFFYKTIIYRYSTISTPELNKYIIDGLYRCL